MAWLALALTQSGVTEAGFAPVPVLWLFAVRTFDAVSITLRRILTGQSPFLPDRYHLHHIVMHVGYRDRHALFFITLLSVILGGFSFWMGFAAVREW